MTILWIIFGVIILAFISYLIIPSDSWEYFKKLPDSIDTDRGYYPCKRTIMKFKKWQQLFELDPISFSFVRANGTKVNLYRMDSLIRRTHPVFYDKDEEIFYLVDFRYLEFIHYYYYERRIRDRISFLSEEKMTKAIVGDVQSKIDALVEESEKHIKDTLKLQEKIVLRMSGEDKEESE